MPVPSQSSSGLRVMLVRLITATTGRRRGQTARGACPRRTRRGRGTARAATGSAARGPWPASGGGSAAAPALRCPRAGRRAGGSRLQDRVDHLHRVVAGEGQRAREQLVEDDAEREDVACARRGRARGPARATCRRRCRSGRVPPASCGARLQVLARVVGAGRILGQPEVEDLHPPALRDHHVRRTSRRGARRRGRAPPPGPPPPAGPAPPPPARRGDARATNSDRVWPGTYSIAMKLRRPSSPSISSIS